MHYYQHHIGDFIKATARLSDSQAMAYLRLLWMYYDSEKPLKRDSRLVAFQIGTSIEEAELLLESFFRLEEDGWHHTRCDQEIADYHLFLEKKSNAGRASAERRKINSSADVQQVLNSSPTDEQLTTNQQPLTINHKPNRESATVVATPEGVSDSVWQDFLKLRKAKKALVTQTVIAGIQKQADEVGWTLEAALTECVVRGWQSFRADWVKPKQTFAQQAADIARTTVPARNSGPDPVLLQIAEDRKKASPPPANLRDLVASMKGALK